MLLGSKLLQPHQATGQPGFRRLTFVPATRADAHSAPVGVELIPLNEPPTMPAAPVGNGGPGPSSQGIPAPLKQQREIFRESDVVLHWTSVRNRGAGFYNLGNTCFMNSVLQALAHTPPLAELFLGPRGERLLAEAAAGGGSGFNPVGVTLELVRRSYTMPSVAPKGHANSLRLINKRFRLGRQEDSHEFLRCLLDVMHEACLRQYKPKPPPELATTTFVYRIFGGKLRSQIECDGVDYVSRKIDPFLDLSLEINRAATLERALWAFTAPEVLDGANKYRCPKNNKLVRAVKRISVEEAPNVLTVHLKRFAFGGFGAKINKKVDYGTTLDLRPFMSNTKGPEQLYDLYGVLVHHGHSVNSGHYVCYVRASSGLWHLADDHHITAVGEKAVLDQRAYILFYVRRQPRNAAAAAAAAAAAVSAASHQAAKGTPLATSSAAVAASAAKRDAPDAQVGTERPGKRAKNGPDAAPVSKSKQALGLMMANLRESRQTLGVGVEGPVGQDGGFQVPKLKSLPPSQQPSPVAVLQNGTTEGSQEEELAVAERCLQTNGLVHAAVNGHGPHAQGPTENGDSKAHEAQYQNGTAGGSLGEGDECCVRMSDVANGDHRPSRQHGEEPRGTSPPRDEEPPQQPSHQYSELPSQPVQQPVQSVSQLTGDPSVHGAPVWNDAADGKACARPTSVIKPLRTTSPMIPRRFSSAWYAASGLLCHAAHPPSASGMSQGRSGKGGGESSVHGNSHRPTTGSHVANVRKRALELTPTANGQHESGPEANGRARRGRESSAASPLRGMPAPSSGGSTDDDCHPSTSGREEASGTGAAHGRPPLTKSARSEHKRGGCLGAEAGPTSRPERHRAGEADEQHQLANGRNGHMAGYRNGDSENGNGIHPHLKSSNRQERAQEQPVSEPQVNGGHEVAERLQAKRPRKAGSAVSNGDSDTIQPSRPLELGKPPVELQRRPSGASAAPASVVVTGAEALAWLTGGGEGANGIGGGAGRPARRGGMSDDDGWDGAHEVDDLRRQAAQINRAVAGPQRRMPTGGRVYDEWDEEYDKGRTKKVRSKRGDEDGDGLDDGEYDEADGRRRGSLLRSDSNMFQRAASEGWRSDSTRGRGGQGGGREGRQGRRGGHGRGPRGGRGGFGGRGRGFGGRGRGGQGGRGRGGRGPWGRGRGHGR